MSRTKGVERTTTVLGETIVAIAVIWAGVMIASAFLLQGTEYFSELLLVLGGGAATTIILLGNLESRLRPRTS